MTIKRPISRVLATLLAVGICWCGGCGGGLSEGIPSNIDPNKPSPQVKAMLEAGKQAQLAAAKKATSKKGAAQTAQPPVNRSKSMLNPQGSDASQ